MSKKLTYEELEQRVRELEASNTLQKQSFVGGSIESIQAGIVVHGRDGTVIENNTTAQIMLGLTHEQMLGKELIDPAWTFLREDCSPLPVEEYPVSRVLATKKPVHNLVVGIQQSDKAEPIWVLDTAIPEFDENGHLSQIITTFTDISTLKRSEEQYRNLFENIMHEVHLWKLVRDEQGAIKTWRLVEANPAALKAWGKNRLDIIGKTTNEIFSYDATKQFMPIVEKIFSDGKPYTWDAYFPPTDESYHMTSVPFGEYFISTGIDITERKKIEDALRKSEERHRLFYNPSFGGSIIHDQGRILDCSKGITNITGYSHSELVGMDGLLLFAPDWRDFVMAKITSGFEEPYEVEGIRKDGTIFPLRLHAKIIQYHGKLVQVVEFRDISDIKKAEQALKASEEQFRTLVNENPFPIVVVDIAGEKILHWSESAQELFGYRPETSVEWFSLAYPDPQYRQEVIDRLKPYLERARHSKIAVNTGEYQVTCRDGSVKICEIYAQFISDSTVFTNNDITERKRAEVEIRASREFLNTLIDLSMFGMWISDQEGTVIQVNRVLCETMNLADDQIVGKYNVFKDDNLEAQGVMPKVRSVFEEYQPAHFTIFWQATGNSDIAFQSVRDMYIDVYMFPIIDAQKKLKNVVCQWVDISELKNAEKKLREMVEFDALTQVYSRQHLLGLAERMFMRIKQDQTSLLCMMFDIDHFKSINDQYGHKAGDIALIAFSEIASKNLRSNDIFGRLGGEEFLAVVPRVSLEVGKKLAEKIRAEIEKTPVTVGADCITMTVSVGISIYEKTTNLATFDELMELSDRALYAAKDSGRNRICVDNT